jgi:hypothetical protein
MRVCFTDLSGVAAPDYNRGGSIADEPAPQGVSAARHHDRNGRGRLPGGTDGHRAISDDDVRLEADQLRRRDGHAIGLAPLVPPVDGEILSLDVGELTKPLANRLRRLRGGSIQIQQDADAGSLAEIPPPEEISSNGARLN